MATPGIRFDLHDNEEYSMPNPMETTCTILSSVGISPEYNALSMVTELWYDMASDRPVQVGSLTFITDTATGNRNLVGTSLATGKRYRLVTNVDIENFKSALMNDNGIQDNSGMPIVVQYRSEDTRRLEIIEKGDWIDLYADETVEMKLGDFHLIHLGVAMKLPDGYEGHLAPRSSTFKKWGIIQANSVGVIDNSYCGPNDWWMFPAIATRDTTVNRGDKICQFRIIDKQPKVRFVEGKMESDDRGGFGSTGAL